MIIAAEYSFNGGRERIRADWHGLLKEIETIVGSVNESGCRVKKSKEKTMRGRVLYSPKELNKCFTRSFESLGWNKHRESCEYPTDFYRSGYTHKVMNAGAFREMDFVKNRLGVEVQFGKYAFMVYNVCAKMTIFHNLGIIDAGVEIVPVKVFADQMSTGVSYFEQFVWDLEKRGVSNIDIPVLVFGVDAHTPSLPNKDRKGR